MAYYTRKQLEEKIDSLVNKTSDNWMSSLESITTPSLDILNQSVKNLEDPCSREDINNLIKRFNNSTGVIEPNSTSREDINTIVEKDSWHSNKVDSECTSIIIGENDYNNKHFYYIKVTMYHKFVSASSYLNFNYRCEMDNSEDFNNPIVLDSSQWKIESGKAGTYTYGCYFIKPNDNKYIRFVFDPISGTSGRTITIEINISLEKYHSNNLHCLPYV